MHLGKFLRIAITVLTACLALWAANGLFYLFNHPTFPGEAILTIVGLALLASLVVWLAIQPVQWLLHALFASHERPSGDR
jgi:hypothetical protein